MTVLNAYLWGLPGIALLVGTGLFLTLALNFVQIRRFKQGVKLLIGKTPKGKPQPGEITRFQALSTALSGTVGTGNIAGVATAITMGGPGAIFWMWITAFFGMATKFSACMLAVKFRHKDRYGVHTGGPMWTLSKGLKMPTLGAAFALFTIIASFGIGNTVQVNSITEGIHYIAPSTAQHSLLIGIGLSILVGLVILGGVKRIAQVAGVLVPFMALAYCSTALIIILIHIKTVPHALWLIFNQALNPQAAAGGTLAHAMRYGIARGVFSNEAGLGSAAIAHAAAKTDNAVHQGFVAMLGPFIDTLVICTMTALVIVIMANGHAHQLTGAALSSYAFAHGLDALGIENTRIGAWIVGLGLIFFAYTTIIAWSYYGDRAIQFLLGDRAVRPYRVFFTLLIVVGALLPLQLVWQLADTANILMAIPNLISLFLLVSTVRQAIK